MQKNVDETTVAGESRSGKVDDSEAYRSTCNVHVVCACICVLCEVVHDSH